MTGLSLKNQQLSIRTITLGLSVHRPEMIPYISECMRRHDAIFLEEPPADGFEEMLTGTLAVEDYLRPLDVEYPDFSRKMCYLLRKLKAEGKAIFQVEPYMEILLGIHAFFAAGHRPGDLQKDSIQYPVYLAERNATGALLDYYQTAMTESFGKTLEAVKRFARLDAARFRLRDSLRAQALAPLAEKFPTAYIEAVVIHYPLWRLLRRQFSAPKRLQVFFLADAPLKILGKKRRLYSPGDQLTLLYIFQPNTAQPKREAALAARSLIYAKLIAKEERTDDLHTLPHLRDELMCIQTASRLSLDDCRRLFPLVRRVDTKQAHQILAQYQASNEFP
jgi:hypothetical protein